MGARSCCQDRARSGPCWHASTSSRETACCARQVRAESSSHPVRAGNHIGVLDGRDAVESVYLRSAPLPATTGALPDVERDLLTRGADGLAEEVIGATSGEVTRQYTIRAPVPSGPLPG